jgi:hypothetical protein
VWTEDFKRELWWMLLWREDFMCDIWSVRL